MNTQTVSEKYNILPSAGLLLFPEDVEKDDWLHNPDPNEKEKDCDIFTKRGFVNVGGLVFITLGVLVLFIGYPVMYVPRTCLSFVQLAVYSVAQPQYHIKNPRLVFANQDLCRTWVEKYTNPPDPCALNPDCINVGNIPLFKNIRSGLIDPDTPHSAYSKTSVDGTTLNLVVCCSDIC